MQSIPRRRRLAVGAVAAGLIVLGGAALVGLFSRDTGIDQAERLEALGRRQERFEAIAERGKIGSGEPDSPVSAAAEAYEDRAFPSDTIASAQQQDAYTAFLAVAKRPGGKQTNWQPLGPTTGSVPGVATYTGRDTVASGRVTALALSPRCKASDCKIFAGAAGGGVWQADNALASQLNWRPSGDGIPSNAIGSILFDPTDAQGRTLYVGTGEPSGSSDSEAGVGLYKSTDFGRSWSLVSGSMAAARDRGIAAIAVDPADPNHIFIGTAVARHGSSSVNGGRFTPPGAPVVGLYESRDGGASFALAFSRPSDPVNPASPTGADFFRGGVSKIALDRTGLAAGQPTRVYAAFFSYGVYRSSAVDEGGDASYKQVFSSAGMGSPAASSGARTEFALAPKGDKLRVYVGDTGGQPADFYRVDNANVPASTLTGGTANPGWTKLSNSAQGTPGFGSYNFCGGQCTYDMVVYSPPGAPDTVYLGGQMQYDEIFTANQRSNGRAVIRSGDAGVHFTDMTNDAQSPPLGMHPDQHGIVSAPGTPDLIFAGSDGGVVRTSGSFTNRSGDCAGRGLSGPALSDCKSWLSAIPTQITSLNRGLNTLQFQSLSVNPKNPLNDIIGGTQDNGTWAYNGKGNGAWFESIGGDGGQSGIDAVNPNIRFHNFYNASPDVNFRGTDPLGWNWIGDPLYGVEPQSFYVPMIADPKVGGTMFAGLSYVWRTKDNGGPQAYLEQHCNEYTGDFAAPCGDWVRIGSDLNAAVSGDSKPGGASSYVTTVTRASSDSSTIWAGTRRGRVWISKNADANDPNSVTFARVDTPAQPARFVSGIAVDPSNPNHAWVSFSGYSAYTPSTPGHVFEVTFDPNTGTATWKDLTGNLGDLPVTSIARDAVTGDLFAGTDFGVAMLAQGSANWAAAAGSLPAVTVYGLTIDATSRVLYAATHGRGAWKLDLGK